MMNPVVRELDPGAPAQIACQETLRQMRAAGDLLKNVRNPGEHGSRA